MDIEDIDVFIGIDVGKSEHWATALNQEGRKVFDRALPNDEDRLRALYGKLADHGNLLAVIAGAARTMPHTLRAVTTSDEETAALSMLTDFDLDLARQLNQTANPIRSQSFTQTPPWRPW